MRLTHGCTPTPPCTKQLLLFTQLLWGLGSHKNQHLKQKPWCTLNTQRDTKTNLRSRITKYLSTQRRPPEGQRGQARHWLSVSGDIYDVWVPEQGWLPWLTALIWRVIQPLGAYNRTGFDVVYCYGIWPHSTALRRDWIVLFVAHLCVCQPGLMACWPQFPSGCFLFLTPVDFTS